MSRRPTFGSGEVSRLACLRANPRTRNAPGLTCCRRCWVSLPETSQHERPRSTGVVTHQRVLAVLNAATMGRRHVLPELAAAILHTGLHRGSAEELTPLYHDPISAVPVIRIAAASSRIPNVRPPWRLARSASTRSALDSGSESANHHCLIPATHPDEDRRYRAYPSAAYSQPCPPTAGASSPRLQWPSAWADRTSPVS
jgi:hypothetical protein